MKSTRIAVALIAALMTLSVAHAAHAGIAANEVATPAACGPHPTQKCLRWYGLNQKDKPDACTPYNVYGTKCSRWYSVGAPAPKPVKEEVIVVRGINFDTAKWDIKPDSVPILEKNVTALQKRPNAHITIEGHTDSRGKPAYNQKLSEHRAQSVLDWFAAHGIDRNRMTAVGKGATEPVADNKTAEGQYQNRRIELHLK